MTTRKKSKPFTYCGMSKMRKEYDFLSRRARKFYTKDARLNLLVYLEDEVFEYLENIARKRKTDVSSVVNQLVRQHRHGSADAGQR